MNEKFKNSKGRRAFLKQASAGALGIGAILPALATSDPVFARMYSMNTRKHVQDVMKKIRTATFSTKADLAFLQSLNNLQSLIEKDDNAAKIYSSVSEFLANIKLEDFGQDSEGLLGLPLALSDALVGGYLSSLEKFEPGAFSTIELQRSLSKVDSWMKSVEPDFISEFVKSIQNEIHYDQRFANLFVNSGHPRLENILDQLEINAGSNQKALDCTINGQPAPVWMCVAIVIIVIIAK